ncbi:hypothetical protein AB3S75_024859 [Citrus x aurantiifolia]
MAHALKTSVNGLLNKLSDRDTYSQAAKELDSIAATVDPTLLPTFLSCILSTNSSDKPGVRKECIHVIATLSNSHNLSPYITKIINSITRNFRDKNSALQATCISTVSSLSPRVGASAFVTMLKLLSDALFTEQDTNAQVGAALCLAAAIDAAQDPDAGKLGRMEVRLERLLKSEVFKAKAAGLVVVGSVIGSGAVDGSGLKGLVSCLLGFLSSQDWAARKAAAEALWRLAVVEKDAVPEFKGKCLKIFESKRFDKVKAVREVMNKMIEAWKQVPDLSEEASPPPQSLDPSKEDGSDGRYPTESQSSSMKGLELKKRSILASKSTPPDSSFPTTARKRGFLKKVSPAVLHKVDQKKPSDWRDQISAPSGASLVDAHEDGTVLKIRNNENTKLPKTETKRALFNWSSDDKVHKLRSGSRVTPYNEESHEFTVSDNTENLHIKHKDCEDLSTIRNQLVQIEQQQSSLLDLLQRFIGRSESGMQSLETRVLGLELALDEISYDLAVSTGRMTKTNSHGATCCMLPGADFLSSKFWRKTEGRYSPSKFSTSSGTSSLTAMNYGTNKDRYAEKLKLENRRSRFQSSGGFIVNPLAEIHPRSRGISEAAHQ